MPQFDFYSFSGQNFWILVSFFSFYFFIVYFYASTFGEMFKMRQKLIRFYSNQKVVNSKPLNLFDSFLTRVLKF